MTSSTEALFISGGRPLSGTVAVNSAKNSALYLIFASLLTPEPVVLRDIPKLSDVLVSLEILEHVGVEARWQGRDLHLHAHRVGSCSAPYSLVSKMRASFVVMGALLARCGEARISMPGGCAFGPRPVDRHIKAFRALGFHVDEEGGDFYARRDGAPHGTVTFDATTVGGTQNVLLASALGSGLVVIENAALEPEIADLAALLNAMGADVRGAGTSRIEIRGAERLHGTRFTPVPDRIEAGTFMLAAAATRGHITLSGVQPAHLTAVTAKLVESGVVVEEIAPDMLRVDARGPLVATSLVAAEYPAIPTDLQAPFGAFLATVPGRSLVEDRVYPDRFTHVADLVRAGADLHLEERTLSIHGGGLVGTTMHAADIRAGGALVVAALAASGTSRVTGLEFIDRGYENLAERLGALGATVERKATADLLIVTGT